LNSAAGLAKKTASLTTSAAVGTVKGSGKAAFYLVSPKHVARREVWGVWRLDQQGTVRSWCRFVIAQTANIAIISVLTIHCSQYGLGYAHFKCC
jgi:hypothetical protein